MSTMSKTDANISENKNNILITLLASICSLGPLATDMYLPALPHETVDRLADIDCYSDFCIRE